VAVARSSTLGAPGGRSSGGTEEEEILRGAMAMSSR
jgi:hypothetical protein